MPGVFITATGTDIGKTFVTAGLIRVLRARDIKVAAIKPVVSGFDESDPAGSDPALLLEALGRALTPTELDVIAPWRFKAPLSPDMAARKEARSLDLESIAAYCKNRLAAHDGFTLIEGAGGIMVPLNAHHTLLDLMTVLALPVILIGGTYLGAISHLLSAVDVLKRRDLLPRAIVINESENSSVTMDDTLETVSHFCGDLPLIPLHRLAHSSEADVAFATLIRDLNLS
jgi:dethiobiotin synthetase